MVESCLLQEEDEDKSNYESIESTRNVSFEQESAAPHRFHFTHDDRTDPEDPGWNVSQYFDANFFDALYDGYSGEDGEKTSVSSPSLQEEGLELLHNYNSPVIPRRPRGTSIHEESIYFDPFEDEVLPREEDLAPRQPLSALALSVLVFYNVSGGPFGMEPAVKTAGPLFAILGFLIFPFVWSIPEALVTMELGTAYPEPSGGVAWVEEAFGTKAGMISGYLNWVSGATDNAIYPALFLQYVVSILSVGDVSAELQSEWTRFLFTVGMTIVLAYINYRGLEIVGNLSIVVCIISMSPFVLMCLIGIFQLDPLRWLQLPHLDPRNIQMDDDDAVQPDTGFLPSPIWAGVLWRPFLNNLFWNLNSFDAAGSFAGEIAHSDTVFPKAMALSVLFVVLGYLLPLLVAIGATPTENQQDWAEGYLAAVSAQIGGNWLGAWTVLAAGISNLALFEAEMSSDAFMLMGMARRGLLPKIFCTQSIYGTPTYGILLGTIIIVFMSVADFTALVEMLNFAYSLSLLIEFAAFIQLRITHGHVPRPFRIPLGTKGCILLLTPPTIMILFVLAYATKMTYIYVSATILLGYGLFHLQNHGRKNGWCAYVHVHVDDGEKVT